MKYGKRYRKHGKLCMGILLAICLLCMGEKANAQTRLSLEGEVKGAKRVLLNWETDSTDSVYQLQRAKSQNGTFSILTTVSGRTGSVSYNDYTVSLGKTYYYKLIKLEEAQVVEESAVLPLKIILAKPLNVKAEKVSDSKVRISWGKVEKATGYEIYRSTNAKKNFKKIGSVTGNKYTDTTIQSGKAYYYKVYAVKKKQKSVTSKASDVSAVYMNPAAPTVTGSYINKKIKITWRKVKGASQYYVYKKDSSGKYVKLGTTKKLYYVDSAVAKGKNYTYKVMAAYTKDGKTIKSKKSKQCRVLASTIDPSKKMVAMTFDDGPGKYTREIVNCLKQNNAKATFFVIGSQVDSYKSAVKAASDIGCEIGNHTYTHPNLTKLSVSEIKSQIRMTDKRVKNATGKTPALVRTPGGAVDSKVEKAVGKPIILWSIDTRDWETQNRDKTINAVMGNVKDGDIILMHDIYEPTKDAACTLIVKLKREGYQLVTVSEMAQYRGYTLKKGTVYNSLRKK